MTAIEFTDALTTLGWSQRYLCLLLGCDPNLALRWSRGEARIPPPIARWLERLTLAHERWPVPQDWRVRNA